MVSGKRPSYRQKGKMNLLGQFIQEISRRQGISWEQYAREAGLDASTLSRMSTEGGNKPQLQTIQKLWKAMRNHDPWLNDWKAPLFNLAGHRTEEQLAEAFQVLMYLREHPDYPDGQEVLGK